VTALLLALGLGFVSGLRTFTSVAAVMLVRGGIWGIVQDLVLRGCCRSECTPSRLARIRQLKLDERDSEKTNDGRLVRVLLYPVIMRGPRDAPDESPRGNLLALFGHLTCTVECPLSG
jgi:hypothetical protein